MIILRKSNGYAHNLYVVLLDTKEELTVFDDKALIMLADHDGDYSCFEKPRLGNFGGWVEKKPGKVHPERTYAKIKVYTD